MPSRSRVLPSDPAAPPPDLPNQRFTSEAMPPGAKRIIMNSRPPPVPMRIAWQASARARSSLPEPIARAIAEETPPPMAPDDICCVIMIIGKTSAIAASGSVPSRPL